MALSDRASRQHCLAQVSSRPQPQFLIKALGYQSNLPKRLMRLLSFAGGILIQLFLCWELVLVVVQASIVILR